LTSGNYYKETYQIPSIANVKSYRFTIENVSVPSDGIILHLFSIPDDSTSSDVSTLSPEEEAARKAALEAEKQRLKEEAATQAYWANLNESFPEGHTFFSIGLQKYFAASEGDKIKIYTAGQVIWSVTAKELFSEAGDNAKIYILGKGYRTIDGVNYETVKYEIRDGEAVIASGEVELPQL